MRQINCKVHYRVLTTSKLGYFARYVKTGIYTNPTVFLNPPVSAQDYNTSCEEFSNAAAEYKQYGKIKKTDLTISRKNLVEQLDQLAVFADEIAQGNVSTILLSGFTPSRESFKRVPTLDKIKTFTIVPSVLHGHSKVVIPAITDKGAVSYCCICVEGAPLSNTSIINGQFVSGGDNPPIHYDFNKSRVKVFQTLKQGTQYFFYVFAQNSVSVSPLSECQSIWVS